MSTISIFLEENLGIATSLGGGGGGDGEGEDINEALDVSLAADEALRNRVDLRLALPVCGFSMGTAIIFFTGCQAESSLKNKSAALGRFSDGGLGTGIPTGRERDGR